MIILTALGDKPDELSGQYAYDTVNSSSILAAS